MNRRAFSSLGIAAAGTGLFLSKTTAGQESTAKVDKDLPSTTASPAPCSNLPQLPAPSSKAASERLLPGFTSQDLKTSGATIRVLTKGDGPPLMLLHGHPETHVCWHKIAPTLAEQYTVVLPDLRGYGDSSKPDGGVNHVDYSFRAMGQDQVDVMRQLGHSQFMLVGHDRGARTAHRMCLDHPAAITKVVLLDIAPTLTMYERTNMEFATRYLWWFLQIQPAPMPEHIISSDSAYYLREHLDVQGKTPGAVTPEAMAEYLRCYCCKGTIHAVCEDYRAAAGIDLDQDKADDAAGNKVQAPLLALWGAKGVVGQMYDVLATWRPKANSVSGKALPCGHLIPEEWPNGLLTELQAFLEL